MMNAMKNVFTVIFSVVLLIAVLAVRIVPLALFIFLIIQSYLHNIEYHKAILIAISVSSIFLLFGSIITSNELLKLNYKEKYSNKMIVGGSIMDILKILAVLASAVLFYLNNITYAYYLALLQFVILDLYSLYTMLYKEFRTASIISIIFNTLFLILGLIFIKHAEIILIVYYIVYYIIFLKKFYLKR